MLWNAARHATARTVTLTLSHVENEMRISTDDDGVGFSPEIIHLTQPECAGFGLSAIWDRAQDMGGELRIDSVLGRGSHIVLVLPYREASFGSRELLKTM